MKHFSEEDWADYGRGVAAPELAAALQHHLDSGCEKCLKSIAIWQTVLDIAREEAGPAPPEGVVCAAEACYGVHRLWDSASRVPTLAELVFDSFRQPAPAGARSFAGSSRQLLYKSEEVDIDIHTHFQADSNRIFLTGQVLDVSKPNANMKDIPVTVVNKSGALAQTVTNGVGEFELQFVDIENLWLKIDLWKQRTIVMVLRDLQP